MTINFHSEQNKTSYAKRSVDPTWTSKLKEIIEVSDKKAVDIGCGGGIYSKALADLGAFEVTAVDFSQQMLSAAKENCNAYPNISYAVGDALNTHLPSDAYDIVLQRALIHHLTDLPACFKEAHRILQTGGTYIVQDRTPEDCLLEGSPQHIRGYFITKYPDLANQDIARRHTSDKVMRGLAEAGFHDIREHKLWEIRKVHANVEDLAEDILARTGRSILHELSDSQLSNLVNDIKLELEQAHYEREITEKDRWTIWVAKK